MLYTVVPVEMLSCPPEPGGTEFKKIDGGLLEVRCEKGQYHVVRLISSDPMLYLKAQYSPGSVYPPPAEMTTGSKKVKKIPESF